MSTQTNYKPTTNQLQNNNKPITNRQQTNYKTTTNQLQTDNKPTTNRQQLNHYSSTTNDNKSTAAQQEIDHNVGKRECHFKGRNAPELQESESHK
jgi:hypothetical protein